MNGKSMKCPLPYHREHLWNAFGTLWITNPIEGIIIQSYRFRIVRERLVGVSAYCEKCCWVTEKVVLEWDTEKNLGVPL